MNASEQQQNTFVNPLPSNNANMYHMNNMPYQNLPNGQYIQSQLDSRYLAASQSNINNVTNTTSKGFDMERLHRAHKQAHAHDHDHSNSSSDSSDDSNNESDSSSADSDAEKDDKETSANRVVKPLRLNLSKVCNNFFTLNSIRF